MTRLEKRAVAALAAIFALRMFGLFMLLPVLAIYATRLADSTPLLVGLAFGVYGLTQGLFQIAFGIASDRFGRRRVITAGLLVFALGGVIAALADSMLGLVIGRAIQGAGAVSAATLALVADLTSAAARTKAMAVVGISIGAAFVLSLMLAPPLQSVIGVAGIFWLSAALALAAIGVLWRAVPEPRRAPAAVGDAPWRRRLRAILADAQLMRLNGGVFCLHLILTALFVALPARLVAVSGLVLAEHWKVYAPVLLLSALGMWPLVKLGSRQRRASATFSLAIALLLVAVTALASVAAPADWPWVYVALPVALWLFFVAFNTLEAMLPSLVSRLAPAAARGAAIGVYSTFQFLGMFAGGLGAGWMSSQWGAASIYWLCVGAAAVWLMAAAPGFRWRAAEGESD